MRFPCVQPVLMALLTVAVMAEDPGQPGRQVPAEMRATLTREVRLPYLLYLPKGYAESSERVPLVLSLHGAGERGTELAKVAVHGPPKRVAYGEAFPFILVSPQCPEGRVWDDAELIALLDDLQARYRVDPKRVYVTGLSMGGYGTWSLISRHPERFAAAAPICGGGELLRLILPTPEQRAALQCLPVRVFHGGKDTVVPLSESERMLEAFRKAGCADIQLKVYPEAGHDSWTATDEDPGFSPGCSPNTAEPGACGRVGC